MRRLLALLLSALLVAALAGCSDSGDDGSAGDAATTDDSASDESGSADAEELCATVEGEVVALLEGDDDDISADALAALDEVVEVAPSPIRPSFETVRDTLTEVSELERDLDSIDAAFELLLDPAFIGAIEQVGLYLENECDIDIETPSEAGFAGGSDEGDGLSAGDLRDHVAAEDPDLEARIESIATLDGVEVSVGVRGLDSGDDAVEICEVVSGYVYDEVGAPGVTITVTDTDTTTFAEREGEDGACEAV